MKLLRKLWNNERGQSLVEYGLLVILIVSVSVAALLLFGPSLSKLMNGADNTIQNNIPK